MGEIIWLLSSLKIFNIVAIRSSFVDVVKSKEWDTIFDVVMGR